MDKHLHFPAKLMVLISLAQGICLLYLHQAIELEYWPHGQPQWLFAFYSVAFILPTMLLLGLTNENKKALIKHTLPFALISGLLGYYIGYQATPLEHVRFDALLFSFIFTMVIATFKFLMYSQQWALGDKITYSALFLWSWRNFLTLSLAFLFAGSFWLILQLWGALFKAIGIQLFEDLFRERWFFYPALTLANGFGIIIFRRLTNVIDTITRLQQALMKFLLVILVLVSLLFLGALPFTGLAPLWESGGSSLILWMQALILFFVNAVYQDEPKRWPYSLWLHRFIYVGVAVLPIYSVISFYGLSVRVNQYGWSLSRYWAFLIWFLMALFPLGYWWGIAKHRDGWVQQLSKVNVVVGLIVLAVVLVVNSPLLDFRKMVIADQLYRLENNDVAIEDFDIHYFRYQLARPGYEALQSIKTQYSATHPSLVLRINGLYASKSQPKATRKEFVAAIQLLHPHTPEILITELYDKEMSDHWRSRDTLDYYLKAIDVDGDGKLEYLWFKSEPRWSNIALYYEKGGEWQSVKVTSTYFKKDESDSLYSALLSGDIQTEPPRWNDIVIGEHRLKVGIED